MHCKRDGKAEISMKDSGFKKKVLAGYLVCVWDLVFFIIYVKILL